MTGRDPRRALRFVALLVLAALPACRSLTPKDDRRVAGHEMAGLASWYGPGFEGKATASGEIMDGALVTAAHRTLPFGTVVRVTTESGRSVDVKINDRGPFVTGRVIDLSRAAGKEIGLDRAGVLPVSLAILAWGDGARTRAAPIEPETKGTGSPWFVQAGAFESHANALALSNRLQEAGFEEVEVVERAGLYRVFLGPHPSRRKAEATLAKLPDLGVEGILARPN